MTALSFLNVTMGIICNQLPLEKVKKYVKLKIQHRKPFSCIPNTDTRENWESLCLDFCAKWNKVEKCSKLTAKHLYSKLPGWWKRMNIE